MACAAEMTMTTKAPKTKCFDMIFGSMGLQPDLLTILVGIQEVVQGSLQTGNSLTQQHSSTDV